MRKHSRLSPSASKRWLNCPGSIKLAEQCPKPKSSAAADLGTAVHALAELYLLKGRGAFDECQEINGYAVTDDMREAVETYIDAINDRTAFMGKIVEGVEEKFDIGFIHEDMFGSNDYFALDLDTKDLYVFDYKNGSGVVVEVEWNSQLMIYALGAIFKLEVEHDIKINNVELIIVQPNAIHDDGPVRSWKITRDELMYWAVNVLKPGALKTYDDNAPLRSGDHCKFCPAMAVCPKHIETAMALAKTEFANPVLPEPRELSSEDIAKVLNVSSLFSSWVNEVKAYAQNELEKGRAIPGFKLVAKRSVRKWVNDIQAQDHLDGLIGDLAYEKKLLTPAKAEKVIKKLGLSPEACLQGYIYKPDNGYSIAPESDRRKAVSVSTAQVDFINEDFLD